VPVAASPPDRIPRDIQCPSKGRIILLPVKRVMLVQEKADLGVFDLERAFFQFSRSQHPASFPYNPRMNPHLSGDVSIAVVPIN